VSARNSLNELCSVLDASPIAITRDWWQGLGPKGDWAIRGKFGHIYQDGAGYLLCAVSEQLSTRRWNVIKEELAFCRLTQDGDSEGCLHLSRLPSSAEAELIRSALGIRKRRRVNSGIIGRPFAKSRSGDSPAPPPAQEHAA
jgi:hypothetical protein